MSINILDFEKPIAEVAEKIEALQLAASDNPELLPQIDKLKSEQAALTKKIYSKLSTWQKVQVARHPNSCLLYTSPSPRDGLLSRMPSSA